MGIYIAIYIALCALCVLCAVLGAKKNSNGLMKTFVILSLAAGFVLALGLYDPATDSGGSVLYVSGSGGTGGMRLDSLLKVLLYAAPPMIIGGFAAIKAEKR